MAATSQTDFPDTTQPFISHLMELRDRLLRVVMVAGVALVALYPFANILYSYIAAPLIAQLPNGAGMIVTGVAAPFMVPFKLTLMLAIAITIPYTLYQLWSFVAPGLYYKERRLVVPLLVSSVLLFYIGMAFAYFIVFPLMFSFFVAAAPQGVAVMTDIGEYLDFVLTMFFAFGAAFEVPIATVLLVWMGVITPEILVGKRPYIIVGAFVIGMFLTPPDAFSQTLIALPMWLLFEAGVFFSRYFIPHVPDARGEGEPAKPETTGATSEAGAPLPTAANVIVTTELDPEIAADLDEAEFDELDAMEMLEHQPALATKDPVERKLQQIHALRQAEDETGARALLYQVLIEGNPQQRLVAQNILEQLDL